MSLPEDTTEPQKEERVIPDAPTEPNIAAATPQNRHPKVTEFTEEQRAFILANCFTMDVATIAKAVSGDNHQTSTSAWGVAVRKFLAGHGQKAARAPSKKGTIKHHNDLTEEHKQFIEQNLRAMRPIEMARILFPHVKNISMVHSEGRAVWGYYKLKLDQDTDMWEEPADTTEYKPPLHFQAMIGRANEYIPNPSDPTKPYFDYNNLRPAEDRNLRALLAYMKTQRFITQASSYDKKVHRNLFESTFIRFVADKATELTPEDVDTFIAAAAETINEIKIQKRIDDMENMIDGLLDGTNDDGERKKLSMTHVEVVNVLRTKLNDCKKLKQSIIDSLNGTLAKRLDSRLQKNASVLNLVEAWREQETRTKLLALGKKEHEDDEKEVNRLDNMDQVKALIAGMTHLEGKL